MGIEHIKM